MKIRAWHILILFMSALICTSSCSGINSVVRKIFPSQQSGSSGTSESASVNDEKTAREIGVAINSRRYGEAEKLLDGYLHVPGNNGFWDYYAKAFLLVRLGQYEEALQILNDMEIDIYHTDQISLRAEIYIDMHMYTDARKDLENALLASRTQKGMLAYALWDLAIREGRVEDAKELLDEMATYGANDQYALSCAFENALYAGDIALASSLLEKLETVQVETGYGESENFNSSLVLSRAEVAEAQGDFDRANDIYIGLAKQIPTITSAWITPCRNALETGNFRDARNWAIAGLVQCKASDILKEMNVMAPPDVVDNDPEDTLLRQDDAAQLLTVLGWVSLASAGFEEARAFAEKAIEANRFEEDAYLLNAKSYIVEGRKQEAVDAVIRGLKIAPDSDELRFMYVTLAAMGVKSVIDNVPDPKKILAEISEETENLHSAFPSNPVFMNACARVRTLADRDGALELFKSAYEAEPSRSSNLVGYASALALSGDFDSAVKLAAESNFPADISILTDLYDLAGMKKSPDLIKLTDYIRKKIDPENKWGIIIDPRRTEAEKSASQNNPITDK